ncbi:MAG: ferredoxin [candidate division Zixibacteria bacterium 4484_93]|nr:MAG: ferredoxin [candidate division Zixibacteria bacterium 4484_93]RKZ34746.1 MAG: ferredoxin [bacterium]
MTVKVDKEVCIACGVCQELCPEVFGADEEGKAFVLEGADCDAAGCCEEAAESCAVEAITIEE